MLKEYTTETSRSSATVTTDYIFYGDCVMQMSSHRVKSALFDAMLSALILAYLSALYVALQVFFVHGNVTQTWQALRRVLAPEQAKKRS